MVADHFIYSCTKLLKKENNRLEGGCVNVRDVSEIAEVEYDTMRAGVLV